MPNISAPVGPSIMGLPSSGAFSIPTPPTPAAASVPTLKPNWTKLYGGKCRYRPWLHAILDGYTFFANGWDQPWWSDLSSSVAFTAGSTVPTSFGAADAGGGTGHTALSVVTYYLAFRNSTIGKETAAQIVEHTVGVSDTDITITWTDPSATEYDMAAVYRVLQGSNAIVVIDQNVPIANETYTDATTDDSINAGTPTRYITRYRTTLPPIFRGISMVRNRLWGWIDGKPTLYYSLLARADDEFVLDDFPASNILQIGAEDGYGDIVAVTEVYDSMYVFKRRAVYEVTGDPGLKPGDVGTLAVRLMFADRGCIAPRTIVAVENLVMFLDERGLYMMDAAGEPIMAAADEGTRDSKLAPIWRRLNLGVADLFWAHHNEEDGNVELWVALDYDPIPTYRVVYSYRYNRFESIDHNLAGMAGGWLEDAAARQHSCRVDDLGLLWEDGVGNSEGALLGDTTGTVTASDYESVTCSAAAFNTTVASGSRGSPIDIYNSGGTVISENRVHSVTATVMELMYFDSDVEASASSLGTGVIPWKLELPKTSLGVPEPKVVNHLVWEYEIQTGGSVRIDAAVDADAFSSTPIKETTMTGDGVDFVSIDLRGRRHRYRFVSRYAGVSVSIDAVHLHVRGLDMLS